MIFGHCAVLQLLHCFAGVPRSAIRRPQLWFPSQLLSPCGSSACSVKPGPSGKWSERWLLVSWDLAGLPGAWPLKSLLRDSFKWWPSTFAEKGAREKKKKKTWSNPEIEYPSVSSIFCWTICPSSSAAKISHSVPSSFTLQPSQAHCVFILSTVQVLFSTWSCLPATFIASICVQRQQSQRSFLPPSELTDNSKFRWSCSIDVGDFFFPLVFIIPFYQQQHWEFVTLALLGAVHAMQLCRVSSKQEGSLHTVIVYVFGHV